MLQPSTLLGMNLLAGEAFPFGEVRRLKDAEAVLTVGFDKETNSGRPESTFGFQH